VAPPPAPRRGRGRGLAIVGGLLAVLVLAAVAVLVVVGRSDTPPVVPGPSGPSTTAQALTVAQVFPSATGQNCRASTAQDQLGTTTGVNPAEAVICSYPGVAPDARVVYSRWPDAAAARQWYQDTVALGPAMDQYRSWQSGGADQGPLWTVERDGTVYSTGIYEGMVYSWEIRTATLDQCNAVWNQLQFRPRTEIGG
jgi:hypothetical protein